MTQSGAYRLPLSYRCDDGLHRACTGCQPDWPGTLAEAQRRIDGAVALCNEVNPNTGKRRSIVNPDRLRPVLMGLADPFPRSAAKGDEGASDA